MIVGESDLHQGKKLVLLEESHGEMLEKKRFVLVNFNQHGIASEQGIFADYREQIKRPDQFGEIQYAKEYYVTENDEIIKFAAICPIIKNSKVENEEEQKVIEVLSIEKTEIG